MSCRFRLPLEARANGDARRRKYDERGRGPIMGTDPSLVYIDPNSQLIRVPVFVQLARRQDPTGRTSSRVHNRGLGVLKYVHYTAKKSAP